MVKAGSCEPPRAGVGGRAGVPESEVNASSGGEPEAEGTPSPNTTHMKGVEGITALALIAKILYQAPSCPVGTSAFKN